MTEENQNIISSESQCKSKSRNQRKLLPKLISANINRTYSNSRYKKREKETDKTLEENTLINGKIKTSSNNNVLTESIDFIKKIKEAKEIKDLEIIYKKWNNEKILSSRNKEDAIKIEIFNKNKKKKESKENNQIYKNKNSEKNEEKKKMLEKLKLFKKKKKKRNNSNNINENPNEDIKKIEKSMNRHLKMIYQKSDLILNEKFK